MNLYVYIYNEVCKYMMMSKEPRRMPAPAI